MPFTCPGLIPFTGPGLIPFTCPGLTPFTGPGLTPFTGPLLDFGTKFLDEMVSDTTVHLGFDPGPIVD